MSRHEKLRLWIELLIVAGLMALGSAFVRHAHGQLLNDRSPEACARNKAWLERCWQQGVVARIPCGTLYLRDTAETPNTIGCGRMATNGSGGYWYPSDHPSSLAKHSSRIRQLTPGKPALRLRGAGFICTDPLVIEGAGDAAAIEVEGRAAPVATGRHRFANLVFHNWQAAFKCLAGYYKDGQFVADENHADNSSVADCEAFNCDRVFWSQNQQAVNWYFRGLLIGWDGPAARPVVAFDVERGGKLHCVGLEWCVHQGTLFRVRDYSPNNCWLTCSAMSFDRQANPETYLTIFEFAGPANTANYARWVLDVDGFASQKLPADKLYNVPSDLPRDQWCVAVRSIYP